MERFVFKYLLIESKDGFLLTGSSAFAEDDRAEGRDDSLYNFGRNDGQGQIFSLIDS